MARGRASLRERASKWTRRHRSLALTAVIMLLLLAVGSLISTILIAREQSKTQVAYHVQQQRTIEALAGAHSIEIVVRPVAAADSDDRRGRSPVTGTSAESAHQSRHQTDPSSRPM